MNKINIKNSVVNLFGISVLIVIFYFIYESSYILFNTVKKINTLELFVIFFTVLMQLMFRALRDKVIYNKLGVSIRKRNLLNLYSYQNVLNYLPFKIGTLYTFHKLKNDFNINYVHSLMIFIYQNCVFLCMIFLINCVFFTFFSSVYLGKAFNFLIFTAFFISLIMSFYLFKKNNILYKIITFFKKNLKGEYSDIELPLTTLFSILVLTTISFTFVIFRYHLILNLLVVLYPFEMALNLASSAQLSLLFSITPAGLGIRESFFVGVASLYDFNFEKVFILSVIDRSSVLIFCSLTIFFSKIIGLPSLLKLFKRKL